MNSAAKGQADAPSLRRPPPWSFSSSGNKTTGVEQNKENLPSDTRYYQVSLDITNKAKRGWH
jgi:hypothetical protein